MADLDLIFTASDVLDPRITFSRTTTGTYYDSAGVLRTAAINAPRFDYDPVTHAAKGLLIEEARTNGSSQSQDFSNAIYTKTGLTVTVDQTTAPDGTTTADRLTASASPASVNQSTAVGAGVSYVQSVYAKKGTSDWFYLCGQVTGTGAGTPKAWFNLATGTVGTIESPITAATIQDVGNGWYRCTLARLSSDAAEFFNAGICDADASATVTVGRTIYLWGTQTEVAAFATSYFPTISSATRAADVAVMTGTNFSSWYNQTSGTFVAEFDVLSASGKRAALSADNTASSQQTALYGFYDTNARASVVNSTLQATFLIGTVTALTTSKLGLSFAVNDFAVCFNGGTVATDTSGTLPTPTQLRIGYDGISSVQYLTGHLRSIQFWNVAKSDAELIILSDPATPVVPTPPVIPPVTEASATTGSGGTALWDDWDNRQRLLRKRRQEMLEAEALRIAQLLATD